MKKLLLCLGFFLSFLPTNILAQESSDNEYDNAEIASIYGKTKPNLGDFINLRRPFSDWVLDCDLDLTNDKRVCRAVQQVTLPNNIRITIKIANSVKGTPFVILETNKELDNKIIVVKVDNIGFEKVLVPENGLSCTAKGCQAAFPLTGITQSAILTAKKVAYSTYIFKAGATTTQKISINGKMDGLTDALKVASQNPYASLSKQLSDKDKPKK